MQNKYELVSLYINCKMQLCVDMLPVICMYWPMLPHFSQNMMSRLVNRCFFFSQAWWHNGIQFNHYHIIDRLIITCFELVFSFFPSHSLHKLFTADCRINAKVDLSVAVPVCLNTFLTCHIQEHYNFVLKIALSFIIKKQFFSSTQVTLPKLR